MINSKPSTAPQPFDQAQHFLECGRLNANLTLSPGARMVITDDLLDGKVLARDAMCMAAIVGRDVQVARAALLPLGLLAAKADNRRARDRFEELFALIEEAAFDEGVRVSAQSLLESRFRENRIREMAEELGATIGPARLRYQAFLKVIKYLQESQIGPISFVNEFLEFTREVAGKLDFGIYTTCVDRLWGLEQVRLALKARLLQEILKFPPLIRKELLSNALVNPKSPNELLEFLHTEMSQTLDCDQIKEIMWFTTLKRTWAVQRRFGVPSTSVEASAEV